MNNTDKLLRAFIEASGYEIEENSDRKELYKLEDIDRDGDPHMGATPESIIITTDYTVTKRDFKNKPTLHKIIRQYEKEGMTASEMIGRIMLHEGISNENI